MGIHALQCFGFTLIDVFICSWSLRQQCNNITVTETSIHFHFKKLTLPHVRLFFLKKFSCSPCCSLWVYTHETQISLTEGIENTLLQLRREGMWSMIGMVFARQNYIKKSHLSWILFFHQQRKRGCLSWTRFLSKTLHTEFYISSYMMTYNIYLITASS